MCTPLSSWQELDAEKRDPLVVRREYTRAMVHLRFVCELYALQHQCGRYFIHEHPMCAKSWGEDCIREILNLDAVSQTIIDQC